jgi:hypothetical protein
MRWTKENHPSVCKGWKPDEIERGIDAANRYSITRTAKA